MKKIWVVVLLLFLATFVSANEAGQYRYYTYGQDFNLNEIVVDVNGQRDIDFSSDCNITIRQDSTNILLVDDNSMLNDPIIAGMYYIGINASNTTTWTKGKYSTIMYCIDGNNFGSENLSFILDRDIVQTIIDTNAIGQGLNADQNQLLYDINTNVGSLLDTQAPQTVFTSPTSGSYTDSKNVYFTINDDSLILDVNVIINGAESTSFSIGNCVLTGFSKLCSYTENGFVDNAWNDINVNIIDKYGNWSDENIIFYKLESSNIGGGFTTIPINNVFDLENDLNGVVVIEGSKGQFDFILANTSPYVISVIKMNTDSNNVNFEFLDGSASIGVGEKKVIRMFYDLDSFNEFNVLFSCNFVNVTPLSVLVKPKGGEVFLKGVVSYFNSPISFLNLLIPLWFLFLSILGVLWCFLFFGGNKLHWFCLFLGIVLVLLVFFVGG